MNSAWARTDVPSNLSWLALSFIEETSAPNPTSQQFLNGTGIPQNWGKLCYSSLGMEEEAPKCGKLGNHRQDRCGGSNEIQRLPRELIQHIFLICLPHLEDLEAFKPQQSTPPLSLAQVCRFWRKIALSTPELWAIIPIRGPKDVPFARQWIRRAGSLQGLSIFYETIHHGCPYDLTKISGQIERLEVRISELKRHATRLLADPHFDSLQSLKISVPSHSKYQEAANPLVPMNHVPSLRNLELSLDFRFSSNPNRYRQLFPWSQLTSLVLSPLRWDTFAPLLSLCVSLQEGTFRVRALHEDWGVEPQRIDDGAGSLEHLVTLSISLDDFLFPELFAGLKFGNLRKLSVKQDFFNWYQRRDPRAPPSLPFTQLQNLDTLHFDHHPAELHSLLRHTSKLRKLTICTHEYIADLLDALALKPENPEENILPNLIAFEFRPLSPIALKVPRSLVTMIYSRLPGNVLPFFCPLERFDFRTNEIKIPEWGGRKIVKEAIWRVHEAFDDEDTFVFNCYE